MGNWLSPRISEWEHLLSRPQFWDIPGKGEVLLMKIWTPPPLFNQKLHYVTTPAKPTSWQSANLEWDFPFRLYFILRREKCQFQSILICLDQHWSQVNNCFVNQNAPKISKLQFLLVIFWSQLSSNNICPKNLHKQDSAITEHVREMRFGARRSPMSHNPIRLNKSHA